MKNSEIIHILRNPIKKVIEKEGPGKIGFSFSSRTIAYVIYLYNKKKITDQDIKEKNNPIGIIDPSTNKTINYNSIEECLLTWDSDTTYEDEDFENEVTYLCKSNNLYRFDKEHINSASGPVVDLDEDKSKPNIDIYTVKDSDGSEVGSTTILKDAKQMKTEKTGRTIYNSRNQIVDAVVKPSKSDSAVSLTLRPGAKVTCNNLNMYYNIKDTKPGRVITGEYYLYDGKEVNGRYALCLKPELSGDNPVTIIGYVNSQSLKK